MLDKLPAKLKSGRILVATAGEENVGLYRHDPIEGDEDYRIVTRAGNLSHGEGLNRAGAPRSPSTAWRWLGDYKPAGRGNSKRGRILAERREARAQPKVSSNAIIQQRIGRAALEKETEPGKEAGAVSNALLCADCGQNTHKLDHAHSSRNAAGYPQTICCPCVAKRGIRCTASAQVVQERVIDVAMRESGSGTLIIARDDEPEKRTRARRGEGKRRRRNG